MLKSHFGMGILMGICGIFSNHLFLWTPLEGCFCRADRFQHFYTRHYCYGHKLIPSQLIVSWTLFKICFSLRKSFWSTKVSQYIHFETLKHSLCAMLATSNSQIAIYLQHHWKQDCFTKHWKIYLIKRMYNIEIWILDL